MRRPSAVRWGLSFLVLSAFLFLMVSGPTGAMATTATEHEEGMQAVEGEIMEAHEADAHAAGAESHGPTTEKIWDLVKRAWNFLVLFVVLLFLLKKPIGNFLSGRRQSIAQALAEFQSKKAQAEAKFKQLETKLADLETERTKIMDQYVREGEEEKDKIIANAHEMAGRIKQQAEATIELEVKAAKTDLKREIAEMSAAMAEELIQKNINEQDQKRLVEEYLDKVVQH